MTIGDAIQWLAASEAMFASNVADCHRVDEPTFICGT
jgi:hypothetical protein